MGTTDLLGASEAAELTGYSVRTIKRLALSGKLPHVHKLPGANGAYLFNREDVERLAQERAA